MCYLCTVTPGFNILFRLGNTIYCTPISILKRFGSRLPNPSFPAFPILKPLVRHTPPQLKSWQKGLEKSFPAVP